MKTKISYILLCVIILAGILMNCAFNNSTAFVMEPYEGNEKKDVALEIMWSPELALKKGDYTFEIDGKEYKSANKLYICTDNLGVIFEGEKKNDTLVCKFSLSEDCDNVYIKTVSKPNEEHVELNHINVKSDKMLNNDPILWAFAAFIFMLYLYKLKFIKKPGAEKEERIHIFLLLTALFVSYPAFMPYIVYGHDINFHLLRIEGIKQGLLSGQFPVRIHPNMNNGYGLVSGAMYPELFLYIPAFLRILGVSLVDAYHTFLVLINIAAAFIMYRCASTITRSKYGGLNAALLYTLSTWRLMNVFMRSSLGEALSMVFFPVVLLGLYHIIKGDKKKWYILSLGVTGVLQVHIIGTLITAIVILAIVIADIKDVVKNGRWFSLIKAGVLALLMNIWFLVPFLSYYGEDLAVNHTANTFLTHLVIPGQLLDGLNNCMGDSMAVNLGTNGEMSQSPGILMILAACMCIAYYIFNGSRTKNGFAKSGFMIGIAFIFMSTTLFPWESIINIGIIDTFTKTMQFPWRFLSFASAFIAISFGDAVSSYSERDTSYIMVYCVAVLGAVLAVVSLNAYTQQDVRFGKNEGVETVTMAKEYIYFGTDTAEYKPDIYQTSENVVIENKYKNGTNIDMKVKNEGETGYIEVPLAYYPGYKVYDEAGGELNIEKGSNNKLQIIIPSQTDAFLRVRYEGLRGFDISLWLSIITFVGFAAYLAVGKIIERKKEKTQ